MIDKMSQHPNYKLAKKNRIGKCSLEIVNQQGLYYHWGSQNFESYTYDYIGSYNSDHYPMVFKIAKDNNAKVFLKFLGGEIEINKELFKREVVK
jgi:hypothetical protein